MRLLQKFFKRLAALKHDRVGNVYGYSRVGKFDLGEKMMNKKILCLLPMLCCITACEEDKKETIPLNLGPVASIYYDGIHDGLIAGLGLSGLQASAPGYEDANAPTQSELRKNAIYHNYTALVDQSSNGGFGSLYGPIDDTHFAGWEYLAFVGEGINRASLMVQIPDTFNSESPCIVAGPASGSRGIYGAIGTAGAWGLEKGCALAYTDMNKGTGAVDLSQAMGYSLQLEAKPLSTSDELSYRVPTLENIGSASAEYANATIPTQAKLDAFISDNPNRYSFKHAHSQKNTEKDWGLHTLQAIKFAFLQLNELHPEHHFTADNTLVIAASVSNGGAGVLRAGELDSENLIDGIVAAEPNVNPVKAKKDFVIKVADRTVINHSKAAYEYFAIAELYSACATDDPDLSATALANLRGDVSVRCDALVTAGLLDATSAIPLGKQASKKLLDAGFTPDSLIVAAGYGSMDIYQSLVATYANQYTRSSIVDNLCQVSMAAVDGANQATENLSLATLAASSNGIPRTANLVLMKDDDLSGNALRQHVATSSNGLQDYNLEGALCWWDMFNNPENPLHERMRQGISEVLAHGDLAGKPTIMVHGRSDALIVPNHSSRAYLALNKQVEGQKSQLKYYEITHAQHLDTLNQSYIAWGGVDMDFVPIDYYFKQSADLMYEHLKNATPLPSSQVVHTLKPSNGSISAENLPAIGEINTTTNTEISFDGVNLIIE